MDKYYLLEHEYDYNMKDLSSMESCKNMYNLSKTYTDNQNRNFIDKIQMEKCEFNCGYDNDVYNIKTKESILNKGFSVDKKTCIFKRPIYDKGNWVNQYNISDIYKNSIHSGMLFNYQSKAKTNSTQSGTIDYSKCDSSLLGECKKGPFKTYTRTFTNSYDNCV
tara:strand:+ start:229 stop:720 length:492 start_codon:yes stop_codon:yes gene_type:complete